MTYLPRLHRVLLGGLLLVIVVAVVSPDPFGNNPDIIGDESYFLSSSLSAIEKGTLPGWEFSTSGNYYGGVQTYIDTIALVPVIGVLFAENHFSLTNTKIWIALHTGDLLAVLRLINELLVVAVCGFFLLYLIYRSIPVPLGQSLLFLLFLLLGNSLVIGFVHTAKVWTLYLLLDVSIGILFVAQEYYLAHTGEPFIRKDRYLPLMLWAATAAFLQNYVGVVPLVLWVLYALLLKHFLVREVWEYVRRYWYLFGAAFLLNVSFFWRAAFVKNHTGWWDPGQVGIETAHGAVDWFHRLHDPILYALQGQPLLLLYPLAAAVALYLFRHTTVRKRLYLAIACVHPLLIFIVFHALLGFSLFPRYSLPLTIAGSFAIVILLGELRALRMLGLILSGALALMVTLHAVHLYWKPSSEVVLTKTLSTQFNSATNVFIIEPDANRLSLPLNATSLALLNERRQSMSRYQYLLGHLSALDQFISFKPIVVMADTTEEEAAYRARLTSATSTVWSITTSCSALCMEQEVQAGTCFEVNAKDCAVFPQDIHVLQDFLSYTELGSAYIIRQK